MKFEDVVIGIDRDVVDVQQVGGEYILHFDALTHIVIKVDKITDIDDNPIILFNRTINYVDICIDETNSPIAGFKPIGTVVVYDVNKIKFKYALDLIYLTVYTPKYTK